MLGVDGLVVGGCRWFHYFWCVASKVLGLAPFGFGFQVGVTRIDVEFEFLEDCVVYMGMMFGGQGTPVTVDFERRRFCRVD